MPPLDKLYSVYLDDGTFDSNYSYADLQKLFEAFRDSDTTTLALHFHGGLNSRADGENTGTTLIGHYQDAGAWPVFFIWRSGLLDALRYLLRDIFQRPDIQGLLVRALERVLREHPNYRELSKDERRQIVKEEVDKAFGVMRDTRRAPPAEPFKDLDTAPLEDARFEKGEEDAFADELETEAMAFPAAPEIRPSIGLTTWLRLAKVVYHVFKRFRKKRDHGIWCTVYEEILHGFAEGLPAELWKQMRDACANAFKKTTDSNGLPTCGGTAFLRELTLLWENWPEDRDKPRLVLIGHSCGAVFICEWIAAADRVLPKDITFDVILLASASTFEQFDADVFEKEHRVANLRAFGLTDETEQDDDSMWKAGYSRSLLYLVSGALGGGKSVKRRDEPLVGMQRYYSGESPYDDDDLLDITGWLDGALVWGPTPGDSGWQTDAREHGQFDDYDVDGAHTTVDSIVHILKHGFDN